METKNITGRRENRAYKKKSNAKLGLILIGGGIILPLLLVYLYFAFYYNNHFYSNTKINGINASNMTASKAETAINSKVKAYSLTLEERNGVSDTIKSDDINLHTEYEGGIADLLAKQNVLAWPIALLKPHELHINTMIKYDEPLLENAFNNLNCLKKENNIEPENASISEYGENGYEIVPEKQGAKVDKDKLYEAVQNSIDSLKTSLSLEVAGIYAKPEITSKTPGLAKAIKKMNKIAGAKITYQFGDKTEVLDGNKISKWLSVDDNYKVNFDANGVKEYVDYIGKTYNSFGRDRTFKTSYGKTITVKGGDYGWWLNRPQEVKELTKLVQDGKKVNRDPVYFQTAQQYGPDDIGNTYVEVNLTAQHLFFYKKGTLILQSDFVSGNVSKNWGTPTGTYPVQYKDNDATLVGENYSTPVSYWMPFNKNIGFHDAYWRSEFGKDIYLTSGSHGCINMPPAMAKKMYENIQRGVAVVVYELKGTENYDVNKDKEQPKTTTEDKKKAPAKDITKDKSKVNTSKPQ